MGVSPDLLKLLEMVKKEFYENRRNSKTFQTGDLSILIFIKFKSDTNI